MTTLSNPAPVQMAWWKPVLFTALAGGMGWGIRGQYGHETGAMIAGLLVSLTLVFLLCPRTPSLPVARAIAMGTVAMGLGGSMTYGQTLGLTQNQAMIGNWEALRWGLLGTAVKGGIWIGFAGLFLGMGLGGLRYRSKEMLGLMLAFILAYGIGVYLLNSPHDPASKRLPAIYFSASWYWQPDVTAAELEPRPECWGGLLLALATGMVYAGWYRKDRLALSMACWGILGGALGFSGGQCLQANHAWNLESFRQGMWAGLDPHMNWWNMMETTFGAVMGGFLGLGLWLNRARIRPSQEDPETLSFPVEMALLGLHVFLLVAAAHLSIPILEVLYDPGLFLAFIPMVAIAGGRWWPYLLALPITLIPIAGHTLEKLGYDKLEKAIHPGAGWAIYVILPLALMTALAIRSAKRSRAPVAGPTFQGHPFVSQSLLLCAWIYFLLNTAIFRYPWPWADWTSRTPSEILFAIAVVALTVMVLRDPRRREAS